MDEFSTPTAAELANHRMVDRLIVDGALWSPDVIDAFRRTPRHRFLEEVYLYSRKHNQWRRVRTQTPSDQELKVIYSDRALVTRLTATDGSGLSLPISSSSQPSLMAEMLEDLRVDEGHNVLEVGAGTGYNAALMGCLVGPRGKVTSVEVDRETLAVAWVHLRAIPDRPVQLEHFDGRQGFPAGGPYDRIMVTASTPDLEPSWLDQLTDNGLLLAPVSFASGVSYLIRGTARKGALHGRLTRPAYFMPLRAESERGTEPTLSPEPANGQTLPAPWADWFAKPRLRTTWMNFSHALAFYGWLRGLEITFHTDTKGIGFFGVHDGKKGAGCWLGVQEWRSFGGTPGRDLGWKLWRAFLDAGGPRPTEFRVRVSPRRDLAVEPGENYSRQLSRCQWTFELSLARDRPP